MTTEYPLNMVSLMEKCKKGIPVYVLYIGKRTYIFDTDYKIICDAFVHRICKFLEIPDNPDIRREIKYYIFKTNLFFHVYENDYTKSWYELKDKNRILPFEITDNNVHYILMKDR